MDYYLCGWHVRSELPLPGLARWAHPDGPVDLSVRVGVLPPSHGPFLFDSSIVRVARSGDCRVTVPGVATYGIDPRGTSVVIEMAPGAPAAAVVMFLLTSLLGILCHQRRLLPLHASCVRIGSDVVALVSPSGCGKSTMAAALVQRGHTLLADDVTVIDPDAPGGPVVWPAFPHVRIWRDALGALGLDTNTLERDRTDLERYRVPVNDAFSLTPQPLSAAYLMDWVLHEAWARVEPVTGFEAIRRLRQAVHRHQVGQALLGEQALFTRVGRVGSAVPVFAVHQPHGLEFLGRNVEAILGRHAG